MWRREGGRGGGARAAPPTPTLVPSSPQIPGGGFSGLADVRQVPPVHDDKQQSFWLAETLKVGGGEGRGGGWRTPRASHTPPTHTIPCAPLQYFYLLFSPADALPLVGADAWVLNTEAHPLKRLPVTAIAALTTDFKAVM